LFKIQQRNEKTILMEIFCCSMDCLQSWRLVMHLPEISIHPKNRAAWRDWLAANHTQAEGIWLITYKKSSGKQDFTFAEAIEEALCFGWIDSKPGKLDDERSMLWFAPRKPGSWWSALNKKRVQKMLDLGLMTPAGLAKIEAAKQDGSWEALDAVEALEIPPDLKTAFDSYPNAAANFAAFPRSVKRGILEWIAKAKKPETRAKRIAETARMAAENKRANQWR
jgi:uncharacterized protein YdeI (YjbR/CyaY-like superfamily)